MAWPIVLVCLRFFKNEFYLKMNKIIFRMLTIIYVIHTGLFWHGPLAFLDLRILGFCEMFDFAGFAMFDRVGMPIFVFYYVNNDYENLIC